MATITPASAAARMFGIQTDLSGGLAGGFIAQSVSKDATVQIANAANEVGTVIDAAAYQKQKTYSVEALNTVESSAAEPGSIVTIGGSEGLVSQITTNEQNTDFVRSTLQVVQYDDGCVYHSLSSIQNPT